MVLAVGAPTLLPLKHQALPRFPPPQLEVTPARILSHPFPLLLACLYRPAPQSPPHHIKGGTLGQEAPKAQQL